MHRLGALGAVGVQRWRSASSVGGLGLVGTQPSTSGSTGSCRPTRSRGHVPALAFVAFQSVFAIIAVALISGAIADRAKFVTWVVFTVVWATLVYFPVAHWVFAFDGFAAEKGGWIANGIKAIDFAGGTAIHINAGAAGLALALVLGKRIGFGKEADAPAQPHPRHDRRRAAVVRLVRLQRRVGVSARHARAAGRLGQHPRRDRRGHGSAGCSPSGSATATRPRWAPPPVSSPASSRSPRRVRRSAPSGALVVGLLAGVACALCRGPEVPVRLRRLASTSSASTSSAVSSARSPSASSPRRRRRPRSTGCSTAAGSTSSRRQAIGAFSVLAYSFVVTWLIGMALHALMGFRDHQRRRDQRHRPRRSTPRPATT